MLNTQADVDKLLALVNVGSKADETIIEVMNLHLRSLYKVSCIRS